MRVQAILRIGAAALAALSMPHLAIRASGPTSLAIPGRSNATPWVASHGPFVAVVWGASAEGKTDVFVAVSRDSGASFGRPVQVNTIAGEARLGGELPPRVALMPGQASTPEMVVLWTARGAATAIRTARSHDGGRTFEPAVTLQAQAAPGDRGWPSLALDTRGTAHALWLDHRGLASSRASGAARATQTDGASHDGVAMAQKSGVYYAAADETATGERELAKGVCYCCKTTLAAGPDGSLYAAWRHVYPGNLRDIAFTSSGDGGRTFAPPVRVSEDGWAINGCPDDGPALAVDRTGTVHLVWPTVLDGPTPEGALFYATTRYGRAFTPRRRIPTSGRARPSHPQIVVDGGRVIVAWDESANGERVAIAREVKDQPTPGLEVGPLVRLSTDGPALYPVMAATPSGLLAVWASGGPASVVRARAISLP